MLSWPQNLGHSTETALTRTHKDILLAIDDNSCVTLVLLDLSAAQSTRWIMTFYLLDLNIVSESPERPYLG